jgi:S1-C subfamily serine protease
VLPELIEKGRIVRPWLGLRGQPVRKEALLEIFNIEMRDGFLVSIH